MASNPSSHTTHTEVISRALVEKQPEENTFYSELWLIVQT